MSTRHILTEEEIHTLLHSTSLRQSTDTPTSAQPPAAPNAGSETSRLSGAIANTAPETQKLSGTVDHRAPETSKPSSPNAYTAAEISKPSAAHANSATETSKPAAANPDQVLNIIQSELRQIRTMMASRTSLGLSGGSNASPLKFRILERLAIHGFQPSACEKLLSGLTLASDEATAWQQIIISLETQLPISAENILDHNGIVALVGPTGSGKTTGIAKLATQFIQRHNTQDIGLITTDYYSVGGRDQLCTYGRILDIPVHRVNNATDLTEALTHLSQKRLILIDTPGISHRDSTLAEKLGVILQQPKPIKTILTLAATTHENLLNEIVDAFNYTQLSGVSITKIDEAPFVGHVLSTCIDYQLPIFSFTNGQQIPSHLMIATLEKILNYALKEPMLSQHTFSHQTSSTQKAATTEELTC